DGEPDFFWAPVNTVDDVLADQQSIDAGLFVDVPDEVSSTRMVATPCDFGGTPWKPTGTAPELGANTVNVLQSLGYSPEEIEQLAGSSESN
ncbi:MAG TPA: CoA transferase, partial [Acidimicrobiales bacterium]|nr:CoA transferase [Acidimicrobiales bacterium]